MQLFHQRSLLLLPLATLLFWLRHLRLARHSLVLGSLPLSCVLCSLAHYILEPDISAVNAIFEGQRSGADAVPHSVALFLGVVDCLVELA